MEETTNVEEVKNESDQIEEKKVIAMKNKLVKCVCDKKQRILTVLVIIILAATGFAVYNKNFKPADIGAVAAKAKIEKLIGEDNAGVKAGEVVEESGLYKIAISIEGQPDQYAYVTKDGTKFIQQAMLFSDIEKQQAEQKKAEEEASKPITKSDKPTVDLYVMSFCPFGNQSEDTLKPVYDLLKNKVSFNFHYIVSSNGDTISSLHGEKEVVQNEREACVLKNYGKDKWFSFVGYVNKNCGSDGACWEDGAKSLFLDKNKITSCVEAQGVALMKEDEKISTEAGATGSPTMLINGTSTKIVYQYGNSDAYKQAICDAFNKAPAECAKKLSTETSTTAGGSCTN